MKFLESLKTPNGLYYYNTTTKEKASFSLLAPLHVFHDAFQTVFFRLAAKDYRDEENTYDRNVRTAADFVFQEMGSGWGDHSDTIKDDIKAYLQDQQPNNSIARSYRNTSNDFQAFLMTWVSHQNPEAPDVPGVKVFGIKPAQHGEPEPRIDINVVMNVFKTRKARLYLKPEEPHASWLRFGIGATAVTSIPQGAVTYAAVFGLGLLCNTYITGLAGTITHGITAGIVGLWFGGGRGVSGITSGLLIGAGVFALQTYGLPALSGLLPLSDSEMQLVAGAATILATFLVESLFQVTTRVFEDAEVSDPKYSSIVSYRSEYYLFQKVSELCEDVGGRCIGCNDDQNDSYKPIS